MATSKTTKMDAQGRVIIPPHIRKELNMSPGHLVRVTLENGVIQVHPAEETCAICGKPASGEPFIRPGGVPICRRCAADISSAIAGGDA